MNRRAKHPSTQITQSIEWKQGMPYFNGRLMHYDCVAARLAASERRIEELEKIAHLLDKKAQDATFEPAVHGTTTLALR